jgi:putative ABC transport system ATP-binding protein
MTAALVSLQGIVKVCDEPTGDLDREMAEQIVTHDPKAAQRATRQLHLDKGRLIHADSSLAA